MEKVQDEDNDYDNNFHDDTSSEALLPERNAPIQARKISSFRTIWSTVSVHVMVLLLEMTLLAMILAAKSRIQDECLMKHKSYCKTSHFALEI